MASLLGELAKVLNSLAGKTSPSPGSTSPFGSGPSFAFFQNVVNVHASNILILLRDINQGVWSLVNRANLGGGGGSGSSWGSSSPFFPHRQPAMNVLPTYQPPPPPPPPAWWARFLPAAFGTIGGIGGAAVGAKQALQQQNPFSAAGSMVGSTLTGAGAAMALAPGGQIPGAALIAVGQFARVVLQATEGLKNWVRGLHEANMQFAEFSPAMMGVKVRAELRDIMLSQERGQRRAGAAERTAQAMNRLDRLLAGPEDKYADTKAKFVDNMVGFMESPSWKKYFLSYLAARNKDNEWGEKALAELEKLNKTMEKRENLPDPAELFFGSWITQYENYQVPTYFQEAADAATARFRK